MESGKPKAHSAEYLGDYRDHWWSQDYLALLSRRLGFDAVTRALDVGCGKGHWGRALLPHLSRARLTGLDPEDEWVQASRSAAAARGFGNRADYVQGAVEAIPFPDDTFDLVTCQTVLMHVPDVRRALREIIRVLRPGGLVLAAEPNNMANAMVRVSTRLNDTLDERFALARFQAVCELGKAALGKGHSSVGDELPGLFAAAGLQHIRVWMSERACPLIPPYDPPGQRALVDQVLKWADKEIWIWDRAETLRCYLAGGGNAADFEPLWEMAMKVTREEADAMRTGTFVSPGGMMMYLVAGEKTAAHEPHPRDHAPS